MSVEKFGLKIANFALLFFSCNSQNTKSPKRRSHMLLRHPKNVTLHSSDFSIVHTLSTYCKRVKSKFPHFSIAYWLFAYCKRVKSKFPYFSKMKIKIWIRLHFDFTNNHDFLDQILYKSKISSCQKNFITQNYISQKNTRCAKINVTKISLGPPCSLIFRLGGSSEIFVWHLFWTTM
jgi:hypothetical protein